MSTEPVDDETMMRRLLMLGVPYDLAREAIASTRMDKDETQPLGHNG